MNNSWIIRLITAVAMSALLYGCGGGGGGGAPSRIVSGVAQAGLIKNGKVKIYGINADGSLTAQPIAEADTDANGKYSANIGGYTGAILVKAFGTYLDEASGKNIIVPEAQALQAALPAGSVTSSQVTISVTPLTDIAVRSAGSTFANISAANQAVSQIFGVNITKTVPVPPTTKDIVSNASTADQVKYTTALATLSQYVANSSTNPATPTSTDLQNAMAQISSGITTGSAQPISSPQVALTMQQAATGMGTNPNITKIFSNISTTSRTQGTITTLTSAGSISAGAQIKTFKVKLTGSYGSDVGAIKFSVGIPSGVVIRTVPDTTEVKNLVATGVFVASGQTLSGSAATFSSQAMTIVIQKAAGGFASGEVATLYVDVPLTATVPVAADFTPLIIEASKIPTGASVSTSSMGILLE